MKRLLLILCMAVVTPAGQSLFAQCELEGYNFAGTYNGHAYYVSIDDHSWIQANEAAAALGGYLATIGDADENAFVASIGVTWGLDAGENDGGQWIGLNDMEDEGSFVWSNEEVLLYTNWAPGEPNNGQYGDGLGEDWVEINRRGLGLWNDLPALVNYIESIVEFNDADCDGIADACDEVFDDADCDGTGDGCDAEPDGTDADCDGVADNCDHCDGGDDAGPCDAESFPGFENIPAEWACHGNGHKVAMCHDGETICVSYHAVQAHLDHGDFLGPCAGCEEAAFNTPGLPGNAVAALHDFEVYPNPSNGDFSIRMDDHHGTIHMYNHGGQRIRIMEAEPFQTIDIALPDAGIYFIRLTSGEHTITKRISVVK